MLFGGEARGAWGGDSPGCRLGLRLGLALGVVGLAACAPSQYEADGSLNLRLVSQFPPASILAASTRFFEEELAALMGDRIRIRSFYGGALVTPEETLEATGHGVADAGTGLWIYAPGRLPLGSFEYQFVFNDPDFRTQARFKREMFERIPALRAELAAANVAPPLVFGPLSPYLILSREPIDDLDDLRGKRIAFTPVEYVPVFSAVGAVPVLSPAAEFYERLSLGLVDAVAVSAEVMHLFRLHELAPHLLDLALNTPTPLSLWVNLDYWRRLTPADRERFVEAGRRAERRHLDRLEREVREARDGLREAGVRFTRFSEDSMREWLERIPPMPRLWAERMEARGLPGRTVVETYVQLSRSAGWALGLDLAE